MPRNAQVNSWIAAVLLSTFSLFGREMTAQGWEGPDEAPQDVLLRLEGRGDADIVSEFQRRLKEFDDVRRRLDATLPVAAASDDPDTTRAVVSAHNRALRSARHEAKQGDLFSRDVATIIRRLIRESLHGMNARAFLATITEDDALPMDRPVVNGSYPEGSALTTMPPDLLKLLPVMPAGLEYRFVGRDLILWDPHANLVVDVIPNALAASDGS